MKPPKAGRLALLIQPGWDAGLFVYRRVRDGQLFWNPSEALAQLDVGEELKAEARHPGALPGLVGWSPRPS